MMLTGCITPSKDPILDRSYVAGGVNDMSGWSVGFTWMGDPEEFRDDIVSGSFNFQVNGMGGFSMQLPKDEFALNLLGDTVVKIYYDGEPQFWGFIEKSDIDESTDVVNVIGGDMVKRMGMRKVEYQSATYHASDPPRADVNSKTTFEELIHWWTGETDSDSMFRNEFIEWSETEYRYNFDGNWLNDALSDIAHSCSLTVGDKKHIGYGFWVDGHGDIYLQPYGSREYEQEIAGQWRLALDWSTVKNRIHLRGGIPDSWEMPLGGNDQYSYDAFETSAQRTAWDVTGAVCNESGSYPTLDYSVKIVGGASFRLTDQLFSVSPFSWSYVTNTLGTNLDWTYTDEGGSTQPYVKAYRLWYSTKDGTDGDLTSSEGIRIKVYFTDGSTATAFDYPVTSENPYDGQIRWTKIIRDIEDWDDSVIDWSDIDKIAIHVAGAITVGSTQHNVFLDGFGVFFKEVDLWRKDNASVAIHGMKEAKFQDRRITDWAAGEKICEQILDLLKTPAVTANTSVPYYDPNLHLNDLINVEVEGVVWPLYVNKLEVGWSGDHVSTTINAGRPTPSEEWITAALHILRDQDSEKGTGFQMASTYEQSTCFKDKELFCRTDCQATNCQNEMQLQACFTFAERNPCITTCQRYKERTGWLNRILEN